MTWYGGFAVSTDSPQLAPPKPELRADPVARRRVSEAYPLSFSQQRLWFLDQLSGADPTYNIPYAMTIRGPLDIPSLQKSLDAIVERHDVLRTTFTDCDGTPSPVIATQWRVELKQFDLRRFPPEERQTKCGLLLKHEAYRGFNLARDLMLRGVLIRLREDIWVFLHVSHHIAWEFRSTALMYAELGQLYEHFSVGKPLNLPELPMRFADFAIWQRQFLQGETLEMLGAYWKKQLAGASSDLNLPTDWPRPESPSHKGARYPVVLSRELLDDVIALSRTAGVTPFMALLGAFNVFLYCCTGQLDVCVGSPIVRRRSADIEPMIGFFVNTLVLRCDLSGNPTFRQLLRKISRVVLGAVAHADLPFDKLVEIIRPPRVAGRMPLFQVNFRAIKEPVPTLRLNNLEVSPPEWIDNGTSKFDLSLELVASPEAAGFFEYSTELFKKETVAAMESVFQALLRELVRSPDVPFTQLGEVTSICSRFASVELGNPKS